MGTAQYRGQQGRQYDQGALEERLRLALVTLLDGPAGISDVSVARILEEAGVARSTFYSYYEDKHALVLALGTASLHRLYHSQRAWINHGAGADRAEVVAGMRALLDDFLDDELILMAMIQVAGVDARVREAYRGGVRGYAAALERMMRREIAAGRLSCVDPRICAETLAWGLERTVTMLVPGAGAEELELIAATLADVMLASLRPARA